jgi:hypothetical protein
MKQIRNVIHGLVACGVIFAMVSSVAAQTAVQGKAKVVRIKGPARYNLGDNNWQQLKVGMLLSAGTVIQTAKEAESFVDIVLVDPNASVTGATTYKPSVPSSTSSAAVQADINQNIVRIYENSALSIDKLNFSHTGADIVTDTQLELKSGRIAGSVKKMSAASRYDVKLPNGVAGIRGTTYYIDGNEVKVLDGSVVVAYTDPKSGNTVTQEVKAGQKLDMRTGLISNLTPGEINALKTVEGLIVSMGTEPTTISLEQPVEIFSSPVNGSSAGTPPGGAPMGGGAPPQ